MPRRFSPEAWRQKKYDSLPALLSTDEQQKKVSNFKTVISDTLAAFQQQFREEFGTDFPIVGVIIFGSWARGDAHIGSDLDIYLIVTEDPVGLTDEFTRQLRDKVIGLKVDYVGDLNLTNSEEVKNVRTGKHEMLKKDFILVSPDSEILEAFQFKKK